jgi:hypothetical protein
MKRLVLKTQTWRGDKSHANLEYGVAIIKLKGSYAETIFTVNACDAKLSGDQEDKLDWKKVKEYNTAYLSGDQEDKLVPLRTLQGVLYTTGYETITNY